MIELVYPFPPVLWPIAWEWLAPLRKTVCDDYAPRDIGAFVERSISRNTQAFGISEDGHFVGVITFEPVNPTTALMHVLFRRRFRGSGKTGEAARLACGAVFGYGIRKIMALIPSDNRLAIALAVRCGATVEGTLRNHTVRGGKPLDAVAVGITREEFFANGTGIRRIDRREQQYHDGHRNGHEFGHGDEFRDRDLGRDEHVRGASECLAEHLGERLPDAIAGGDRGHDQPQCASDADGGGEPDQQSGAGVAGPHERVPRVPRVRAERPGGAKRPVKRTDKAKRTGRKPKRGIRAPATAKSVNAR